MSFLSSESFKEVIATNSSIVPYNESRIKHGAYELSLGSEYYTSNNVTRVKQLLRNNEQISIDPGQFALLITEEIITIPSNIIGFISIKAGIKFKGLINISGFHVDPGFSGKLKFSVYNAGTNPIIISQGDPVFLLWFANLDNATTDTYSGSNNGTSLTSKDIQLMQGRNASPAELLDRVVKLESHFRFAKNVFTTLFGIVILGGIAAFFGDFLINLFK